MLDATSRILDWLWLGLVVPAAATVGDLVARVTLGPMNALCVPPVIQVAVIGALTALLSMGIKRLLHIDEKEVEFLGEIEARKEARDLLRDVSDWKVKEVLQNATDSDIDEVYNTYISHKFAWFGISYLLPIFLTLFWLDTRVEFAGVRFVLEFPQRPFGIPGLSVPMTFFIGYLATLFSLRKALGKRGLEGRVVAPNGGLNQSAGPDSDTGHLGDDHRQRAVTPTTM